MKIKSRRFKIILFFIIAILITGFREGESIFLVAIAIYGPVLFFVYKGSRISLTLLAILWTIVSGFKIFTTIESYNFGASIVFVFWYLVTYYIFKTLRFEKETLSQNSSKNL